MYEDAQEILDYLPIRRNALENDYIEHLLRSFFVLDGSDDISCPFAIMPFHLLFMMAVQYKALRIATAHKQATDLFFSGVGGRSRAQLLSEQRSVFDMALINERTMPEIFQLIGVDSVMIKKFKGLIDERNDNLAHAKGGIEQNLERKIDVYLEVLKSIQSNCFKMNHGIASDWLAEVRAGDDMDQFLESHFLVSYFSQRDFGDIVKELLEGDRLSAAQWKQIANKGLELAQDQTIFELLYLATGEEGTALQKRSIRLLRKTGEESSLLSAA
jgi:hypothetical protein